MRGREPARQHLRTPTIQHRLENPVFSTQHPNVLGVISSTSTRPTQTPIIYIM